MVCPLADLSSRRRVRADDVNALSLFYAHSARYKLCPDMKTPAKPKIVAKAAPKKIVARAKETPDSMMARALRLHNDGKLGDAINLYQRVLAQEPDHPHAWGNIGVLLRRQGKYEAAVACLKRAARISPKDGAVWSNLGNALRAINRLDEAIAAQRRALDLTPEMARIHYNYGLCLRDAGNLDEATHAMRRARLLGYEEPELAWDQSLTLLMGGDLETGFAEYEARWNLPGVDRQYQSVPEWDGSPLDGRRLVVWAEQGMGDTLQFCRYLCDTMDGLTTLNGPVTLDVQPPLARLLQNAPQFKDVTVVPRRAPLEDVDLQVPLLSLPRLCHTGMDTIPDHCPYITAPARSAGARPLNRDRFNVGIVWKGKPSHKNDRNRSVSLETFAALFDLPGTDFISLQKGPAVEEIQSDGMQSLVADHGSAFRDFADTAATLQSLDLVISVDTSVAHLAGAMARPVWVLIPYAPDWRWMHHRDDSPWYPSMTLYRQTAPGDWRETFMRMRKALIRKLQARR